MLGLFFACCLVVLFRVWNGWGDDVLTVMISIKWMRYRDCRLFWFMKMNEMMIWLVVLIFEKWMRVSWIDCYVFFYETNVVIMLLTGMIFFKLNEINLFLPGMIFENFEWGNFVFDWYDFWKNEWGNYVLILLRKMQQSTILFKTF